MSASPLHVATLFGSLILTAVIYGGIITHPMHGDADAYYTAWSAGLYDYRALGDAYAYLYSPAFAQAIWPLTQLPWEAFYVFWTLMLLAALLFLVGPMLIGYTLLLFYPAALAIANGNVHLFLAVAVAVGLRVGWPWSALMLTKVTPAVGLLWFAIRGEWRQVRQAVLACLFIAGISLIIAPGLWVDWFGVLVNSVGRPGAWPVADIPLLVRLPVGAAIIAVAAWRGARWLLAVGVIAVLPMIALESGVLLLTIVYWQRQSDESPLRVAVAALSVGAAWLLFVAAAAFLGLRG